MATVNAYLTFNGNCEEAFGFYQSVFGGEFPHVARFKDIPPIEGHVIPAEQGERIMHISLPISKETILMGSDSNPAFGEVVFGQHMSLSVNADTKEEADKIFNGLAAGGKVTMPISDTFWGAYFGMLCDKYGIVWLVNYDYKK